MSIVVECLLDVRHIGSTTREDDSSEQLVVILRRNLAPHILYDLIQTSLNNLNELPARHRPVVIKRIVECIVYVAVVSICAAIFQFHLLGLALLNLQRCDITCDVASAERDDGQMTKDILIVYRHRGSVGAKVNEHTASALLGFAENAVGKSQWSEIELCYSYSGLVETGVQVIIELLAP